MVWPDGKPEKRSAGKERRRTSRLFSEGLQLRNRTGSMRQQTKEYPARGKDSGGVGGLQGKSRMRILASALGACLTRQAGFAAAQPACRVRQAPRAEARIRIRLFPCSPPTPPESFPLAGYSFVCCLIEPVRFLS